MLLLPLNLFDLTCAILLLVTSLVGVWGSFTSGLVAAMYAAFMGCLVVAMSSMGVFFQPGRKCLTMSMLTSAFALFFELIVATGLAIARRKRVVAMAKVDRDARLGENVYRLLGDQWLIALFALCVRM